MHYFDNEAAWEARAEAESWLGTPTGICSGARARRGLYAVRRAGLLDAGC
ncbi:MAG: hypothetical protein ACLT2T_05155 [Bilophila wadsworthia]